MEPWYKAVELRKEVREGRSFNPDEFAIHLEQVVAKTAPEDYSDPAKFFARTCFTKALVEHLGMVLRRLSGRSDYSAPVMTLITQFGGGKTHTLTALYHLAKTGPQAAEFSGIPELLKQAQLSEVPAARVAIFVGNAWDPQEGRETPWIDVARQLAGDAGAVDLVGVPGRVSQSQKGAAFDSGLGSLGRHGLPQRRPRADWRVSTRRGNRRRHFRGAFSRAGVGCRHARSVARHSSPRCDGHSLRVVWGPD